VNEVLKQAAGDQAKVWVRNPLFSDSPITIRQLLTHTSRVTDDYFDFRNTEKIDDWFDIHARPRNLEQYRIVADPKALPPGPPFPFSDSRVPARKPDGAELGPDFAARSFTKFVEFMFPRDLSGAGSRERRNYSNHKPGTYYAYSNLGTALLAYVVGVVAGSSFRKYVTDNTACPPGHRPDRPRGHSIDPMA